MQAAAHADTLQAIVDKADIGSHSFTHSAAQSTAQRWNYMSMLQAVLRPLVDLKPQPPTAAGHASTCACAGAAMAAERAASSSPALRAR